MGLARLRLGALHSLLRHAGSASLHKSARFSSSRKSGLRPEGSNPRGVYCSITSDLRSGIFSLRWGGILRRCSLRVRFRVEDRILWRRD